MMTTDRRSDSQLAIRLATLAIAILLPRWAATDTIHVNEDCTLSGAIEAANLGSFPGCDPGSDGMDVIELTGDVLLTEVDHELDGPNGLPSVVSAIEIRGNDFAVERAVGAEAFRIFHISSDGQLLLRNTTIVGGELRGEWNGAGLLNVGGNVKLVDTSVVGNESESRGGGVANESGTMRLERVVLQENVAETYGGGLWNSGSLKIEEGSIVENRTTDGDGGGIANGGDLLVLASEIRLNTTDGYSSTLGGGVLNLPLGETRIVETTIADNEAFSSYGAGDGGGVSNWGILVVDRSLLARNRSGDGGGVSNRGAGFATLRNSTLSGNEASSEGTQGAALGGGLFVQTGAAIVDNVTFRANLAEYGSAVYGAAIATNTIFSSGVFSGNLCFGGLADGGGNVDDEGTCPAAPILTGLDPVLQDNGGPTETHALLPDSTAIDGAACELATDQRGVPRSDGLCDTGSFEWTP